MSALIRAHTITSSPIPSGARTSRVNSSPPLTHPERRVITPLSYERLLVRFRTSCTGIVEHYPDPADGERVKELQEVIGEGIKAAEAGIAGVDVVSPGNLKHLVVDQVREIHEHHDSLKDGDDTGDEDEEDEGAVQDRAERSVTVSREKATKKRKAGDELSERALEIQRAFSIYSDAGQESPNARSRVTNPFSTITQSSATGPIPWSPSFFPSSPADVHNSRIKRVRFTETQATTPVQPAKIPRIDPDSTAKELFYQGMQFATSFLLANHLTSVAGETERKFHEYVRGELGLNIDHETGEAFEKAVIVNRDMQAGTEKEIKTEDESI